MPPVVIAAGVLAAASVASGAMAAKEQKEAVKYQKKAQRQQTGIEVEKNRRAAVMAMREARIRSAVIAQTAQNAGAKGSGQAGAQGSISSQAGSAVGFQRVQQQAAINTSNFLAEASRAQGKALGWGAAQEGFATASSFVGSLEKTS